MRKNPQKGDPYGEEFELEELEQDKELIAWVREGEEAVVAEEDGDLHAKICLELERAEDEATRDAVLREVEAVGSEVVSTPEFATPKRMARCLQPLWGDQAQKKKNLSACREKDRAALVLLYQKKKQKTTAPIFKKSKKTTNKDASSQPQQSAPSHMCADRGCSAKASRSDRCGALRMRNSDKST